jgi:hypothetical protein
VIGISAKSWATNKYNRSKKVEIRYPATYSLFCSKMWSAKSLTCAFLFTCLFLQDAVVAEEACGIYSCVNGVCISTFSDELRCECVDYWSGENCTDFLPYVIGPDAYLSFHILVLVLNILLLAVSSKFSLLGNKLED